jgi:hypothetical protein
MGSSHYFTPPLPPGEAVISVAAQGGVKYAAKKIVIQWGSGPMRKRAQRAMIAVETPRGVVGSRHPWAG